MPGEADKPGNSSAETIFTEALTNSPTERPAYLAAACGQNQQLRERVEALLRAHDAPQGFLPDQPGDPPAEGLLAATIQAASLSEQPRDSIGPYKLLQKIGEGGCGVVYMAEQEEPVRRKVALKIIKLGMDTKQVVARFEAERQALALMDHPNIAKILDAGVTGVPLTPSLSPNRGEGASPSLLTAGRPYFVMELVGGIKITDYCDQNHLNTRQRLDLFIQVCRAVQHAHHKGVIHRDIKPSNVLVATQDGAPMPKVIDFGIAKATQGRLTDDTVFTAFEQFLGTPAYMSPEQAQLGALDVDTRSDIYSLGVLLYELLAGKTPFDAKELLAAGLEAMRRTIQEKEPPTPSTRLTEELAAVPRQSAAESAGENGGALPRRRHGQIQELIHSVRGDLDWIVMKCLEKDRARRYETANGLARDIERHLNNEPVVASPPSNLYRFQKAVRRNKTAFAAATSISLVLVIGVAVSTWQAVRATRAEQEQVQQRKLAEASEKTAISQKRIAIAIQNFLLRDLLRQADPWEQARAIRRLGGGIEVHENPTIKELLERASVELAPDKIETKFPGQPQVQVSILATMGDAFGGIGEYGKAEEFLSRASDLSRSAFGAENTNTLNTMHSLAWAYQRAGQLPQAIELFERVQATQVRMLGADHADTLFTSRLLAISYQNAGKLSEAIELFERVRDSEESKLGAGDASTLATGSALAWAYQANGKSAQAVELFERVRDAQLRKLGADDPSTLNTMLGLAEAYVAVRKLPQAIELLEHLRSVQTNHLGSSHPETLKILDSLGWAYVEAGKPPQAIELLEQVRDARVKKLGADHPDTLRTLDSLARAYFEAAKLPQAIELHEQVRDARIKKLGPDHPETLGTLNYLAQEYQEVGRLPEAIALLEQLRDASQRKFGTDHPSSITALYVLGAAYRAAGRWDEALPLMRQAVEGIEKRGFRDLYADQIIGGLVGLLEQIKRKDEALSWRRKWLTAVKQHDGAESNAYARELEDLGVALVWRERWAEAVETLRECLTLRKSLWPDDWRTYYTQSMLGGCLLQEQEYSEAEPLLLSGYEGMKRHQDKIPAAGKLRLKETIQRLMQLYETTQRTNQIAHWKAELTEWYRNEVARYRHAAEAGNPPSLNTVAWLLATCEDSAIRNGPDAVAYAEKAVMATNRKNPGILDTLAAAYAEAGQFAKAISVQKEAITLAQPEALKQDLATRLKLYESNTPYRER